jgi:hypothetical protein
VLGCGAQCLGMPVLATSTAYLLAVVAIFYVRHRMDGTLSFCAITARWGEAFAAVWSAAIVVFVDYVAITHRDVHAGARHRTHHPTPRRDPAPGRAQLR